MLTYGNPNPYSRDQNGVTPIHVACAKLDWETLCDLAKLGGEPILPDSDRNTFLHLLCYGGIKDIEYDFAKMACQQFPLKLTRNNEGKTALNMLRSMDMEANVGHQRGQPNYRRKLQNFFEGILAEDPSFEDHEGNNDFHDAIITGNIDMFDEITKREDFVTFNLNQRNSDGKSPLHLTIEHERDDMFNFLMDNMSE